MLRRSSLIILLLLAGCGGGSVLDKPRAVPRALPAPIAAPAVPVKPAWVARKVVPKAVEVAAGTTIVAASEGLREVAARSRVPAGAIAAANRLVLPVRLLPGQVLKLPPGRVHTVQAGETGISIARVYGVDWTRVVAANRLVPPFTLEIGDRLLLPSKQQVAAMTIEERAAAFRINIDDLITGAEPAAPRPAAKTATATRPLVPLPALPAGMPRFDWPIDGRILSGFGPKAGGRYNDGINLKASAGAGVRAAADGVVAYAGDAVAGFGNLVLVKHAGGWVSAYGHNEAVLVARGDRVRGGDLIARAGATGSVDEPQLHFELRRGRAAVDPVKILPARG